jgi:hypothetical protein
MISEKNKKNKCQINMSKANLKNSIIGIFMKTYCLSGDPVFPQFHAFLHFIFKSTQQAAVQYECYFRHAGAIHRTVLNNSLYNAMNIF